MNLWNDIQFSLRSIRKSPRVSITVLLTLALGIGANTAVFSIVDGALLRPLAFREPGQLVQLRADLPGVGSQDVGFSYPELQDIQDRSGIFETAAGIWEIPGNLTGGDQPERLNCVAVSSTYFNLLGSRPQLGRLFDARDDAAGFAEAAVISDAFWHRLFGGARDVVGRRVRLDNDLYTIVGVLPASFHSPSSPTSHSADFWVSAGFRAAPFPPPARSLRFIPNIVARLKPGITVGEAQARLGAFSASLRSNYGVDYAQSAGWTLVITTLSDIVHRDSRRLLISLWLAVFSILLIACVNVAIILVANAASRRREISIRMALGASRRQIVRQLLTESAILSMAAGIGGTATAALSLKFLRAYLPAQLSHGNSIAIDARVLIFSLAISLLTTITFGLIPALQLSKRLPGVSELRTGSSSIALAHAGLVRKLVCAEVALSFLLLAGAGLLIRTFWALLHVDPGFQTRHLMVADLWLPAPNDPTTDVYRKPEQRALLIQEVLRHLRSLPGVESAAVSGAIPFRDSQLPVGFSAEGVGDRGDAPAAVRMNVTPGFFDTLEIPLVKGRLIQDTDTTQTPPVALVDEAAAHRFWGSEYPVGRRLRVARLLSINGKLQAPPWIQVVGVVANAKLGRLDESEVPHVYTSIYQTSGKQLGVLVRAEGDTGALGRAIQRAIRSVDHDLPVSNIVEMKEVVDTGVGDKRFAASLLLGFALIAMLLTSIGVYGVTSYVVARRTKELGIRSALGATPRRLVELVAIGGMVPILVGAIAGLIGANLSGRLMAGLLFGVRPSDVLNLTVSGTLILAVGFTANLLPALRAARVDPIAALRVE